VTGLTCLEAVALLTAWLDGALPFDEAAAVQAHLEACPDCARYVDQLRATVAALGQVSVDHLSPATREGLVQAFRSWPRA
jgi:anti-sigma factor RsiW